jgi:F-type H+-transporting ATPase subunit gamma
VASVQDLKRRIRSIRNTRKITKAMELVASARLRRAQARIEAMRPYADRMMELMIGTARASSSLRSLPLLQRREQEQSVAILPLTGDRGLAGAFNAQVLRAAFALGRQLEGEGKRVRWLVSGRKGASTLRFRRLEVLQAWIGFSDRPAYSDAQAIAHAVSEAYTSGEVDTVFVVYNAFVSALTQKVTVRELLPIPTDLLEGEEDAAEAEDAHPEIGTPDFIYEPEPEEILARLLPVYVETELYRALLESAASEQGARMTAMRNASKAAGELIDSLTLAMNRARQAEITQEILEVVAGADALSG